MKQYNKRLPFPLFLLIRKGTGMIIVYTLLKIFEGSHLPHAIICGLLYLSGH
jgi:hypothetical protein